MLASVPVYHLLHTFKAFIVKLIPFNICNISFNHWNIPQIYVILKLKMTPKNEIVKVNVIKGGP